MSVDVAAEYCGIGVTMLKSMGPKPIRIGQKRQVWLRETLDDWLDRLAGNAQTSQETSWPDL